MAKFATEFRTPEPNVNVLLYHGPITLEVDDQEVTHDGIVELRWLPDLRVSFRVTDIPIETTRPNPSLEGTPNISVPGAIESVPTLISDVKFGSHKPLTIEGLLNGCLKIGSPQDFAAVEFQVANLSDFHLLGPDGKMYWQTYEWQVEIEAVEGLHDLVKSIKKTGGYALTHRARVTRRDKQTFTVDDAGFIGLGLFKFLSFLQGRKVNVILPIGYDATGNSVWRQWAPWVLDPWQSVPTWADLHRTDYFHEAFTGFMDLWQDEAWRAVLGTAIHWYVEANRNASGIEAGAIFTQMALELLAWHYFVEHTKAMTKEGFNRLTAADRIRLLLTHHEIPLDIPATLPDLAHWAGEFNWGDAADAIAVVRNMVVHAEAKLRNRFHNSTNNPIRDARTCGLWLLELLLLRMFRYSGPYSDRREPIKFVGKVETVPWAKWVDEL